MGNRQSSTPELERLYARWIGELWNGPSDPQELTAVAESLVTADFVAGRWTGTGGTPDGTVEFFGNDILRAEGGRFAEYWTASAAR